MTPVAYVSPATRVPVALSAVTTMRAKRLMRAGWSLSVTAIVLDVSRSDLDLSLWRYLGASE